MPAVAARGERLKEATTEAKRTIESYREDKEKQFQELVQKVRRPGYLAMP